MESTYAFGLLQTSIPAEAASLLFLFTPVLLLFLRTVKTGFLVTTGGLCLLSRVASLAFDTRGRMLSAGMACGLFLMFLPAALWRWGMRGDHRAGLKLGASLALAALLHMLLRALGSGNDITGGAGRWGGGALALLTGVLLWTWKRAADEPVRDRAATATRASGWRIAVWCLGLISPWVMLYFGLGAPAVMARWTGGGHVGIMALAAGAAALFLMLWVMVPRVRRRVTSPVLLGADLLFVAALVLTLWSCQVSFPKDNGAYPVPEPAVGMLGRMSLPLMLLLSPILFVQFARFAQAVVHDAPSLRVLGGGFALGSVYLLVAVLAHLCTTAYDYIPVVGPWFRDRFWLVFLGVGLVMTLPVPLLRREAGEPKGDPGEIRPAWLAAAGVILALMAVFAAGLTHARPAPTPPRSVIRVMTFNLQQGYSASGTRNFAGQLGQIREVDPDILGLQESDTARVAGGNSDLVRYLADRLNFHSYYGPRTVSGTFGIALLSRYPIEAARTYYLFSAGEQTAAITAQVCVGERRYHVVVTHLGNGGPIIQQREVLELVAEKPNTILLGDFNFTPADEAYRLTVAGLEDAWLVAGERDAGKGGLNLDDRIDHVFVSPEVRVLRAEYLGAGASDHPMMTVEIGN